MTQRERTLDVRIVRRVPQPRFTSLLLASNNRYCPTPGRHNADQIAAFNFIVNHISGTDRIRKRFENHESLRRDIALLR